MEKGTKNGHFIIPCPYCGKQHPGELDVGRISSPRAGVLNVLSNLPCGNKILLFFSSSRQLRGHQVIDEMNVVNYTADKPVTKKFAPNYNDDYKKFAEIRGMQRRMKDAVKNGDG
jgi:hypothetical protein